MSPWAALLLALMAASDTADLPVRPDTTVMPPDAVREAALDSGRVPILPTPGYVRAASGVDEAAAAPTGAFRPIRTNTPGTGVFIGSGLVVRALHDRESVGDRELSTWRAVADYRHTPATHWVLGVRAPWVLDRSLEGAAAGAGRISTSGAGDLSLSVKHRFFRAVGRWSDRHMAAEVEVELPTGSGVPRAADGLPVDRRHRLAPGSGSVDFVADLIYQEGRRRFVYGGDLSVRLNTEGDGGYRFGHEVRLNLDLEYILFPREYRRPGNEVFVLLETTIRRKWADEVDGRSLERTERTDLLLAPAVQHIISDQLLASLSVQLPAVSDAPAGGLEKDLDVLAELRYAF